MKNYRSYIAIACCAVFFCGGSVLAQNADSCKFWHGWAGIRPNNQAEYKMQYDSLKRYIESCGKNDDSYDAFPIMDGAVQEFAPDDTTRYDRYRNWLLLVLYLNTTQPYYFCDCMSSIASTYAAGIYHHIHNATLAVLKYLLSIKDCDTPGLEEVFKQDTIDLRRHGEDMAIPPLDSIGLGILLKSDVHSPTHPLGFNLGLFNSSQNPFLKETILEFTLNRMSYVTLAIYDELGRLVWGDDKGSSLEAGMHAIHLDGSSLPCGTLYARIATGFGEVKTVKLVHE